MKTAYKRGYFNNFEVVILDFHNTYSKSGQVCRYAKCFIPALDTTEDILLSDIFIG